MYHNGASITRVIDQQIRPSLVYGDRARTSCFATFTRPMYKHGAEFNAKQLTPAFKPVQLDHS